MSSSDEDPNVNIIPMDSFPSDGDMTTWPGEPYAERDDANWRRLLANNWLEKMGSLEKGVINTLDKLPEGYCLFDKPNTKNPHIRNPALFGHPSGRYFPSQNTFLEHFMSIVQGKLDRCKCKHCQSMTGGPKTGRPARGSASASATQPNPNEGRPVDAEGPDYWRMLVTKLKENGELQEDDGLKSVREPNEDGKPNEGGMDLKHYDNVDWILTNEALSDLFTKLELNPAYVPRRGELVLWIWSGLEDGCLMLNPDTGLIEIFGNNKWRGVPQWRAGVITDTPTDEVHMVDIIETPDRPLTYSGFRVETLPDPLGNDKSYSRQYSYIPLRNIKPLNTWQLFLNGQDRDDIHPSIENALTVMSSWSVVHKVNAKGTWPNMQVDCKGIFIGAELLAVHDTIRLRPRDYHYNQHKAAGGSSKVTDVMVIENISVNFTDCIDDPKSKQLAKHYTALITGKMFTTSPDRGIHNGPFAITETDLEPLSNEEATAIFRQVGMSDYGPWYRMAKGQTCNVSPQYVIGRCYEPLAAELMLGTHTFGYDLSSVMEGRNYSQHVDTRMPVGNTWFWGDCRVETLGLTEINGEECGPAALQRETPAKWQSILRVSRGETNHAVRRLAGIPSSAGRPFGAKNKSSTKSRPKTGFAGVAPMSKMVSSAIGSAPDDDSDDENDGSGMTDENGAGGLTGLGMARAVGSDSEGMNFD